MLQPFGLQPGVRGFFVLLLFADLNNNVSTTILWLPNTPSLPYKILAYSTIDTKITRKIMIAPTINTILWTLSVQKPSTVTS